MSRLRAPVAQAVNDMSHVEGAERAERRERVKTWSWLKAHLQTCLSKQVEVVMIRGDPVYGKLIAFGMDSNPAMIVVENGTNKYFINLGRVERIRVATQS